MKHHNLGRRYGKWNISLKLLKGKWEKKEITSSFSGNYELLPQYKPLEPSLRYLDITGEYYCEVARR